MTSPDSNGAIAALGLQYGYNNEGQVDILDAVSFGHRDVMQHKVPSPIWNRIRFLTNPTISQMTDNVNPWKAGDIGFLTLPYAECTFNSPVPLGPVQNDLQLDLFEILSAFCDAIDEFEYADLLRP